MHRALLSHHAEQKRQHRHRLRLGIISLYTSRTSPPALLSVLVIFLSWSSLFGVAFADTYGKRLVNVDDDLAWNGSSLHIDTRPPPTIQLFMPPILANDATRTLSAPPSKMSLATAPSGSSSNFQVPRPFDTGLSNNFTNSCAAYMSRLLKNEALNNSAYL